MKKSLLFILLIFAATPLFAKHIIGGEMFYTYLGKGKTANTNKYRITLRLFRDDHAPADAAQMPESVYIGIFDNDSKRQYPSSGSYYPANRSINNPIGINAFPVCMVNRPDLAYHAAEYSIEVDLPVNSSGYTGSFQTCCRIRPITNIFDGASGAGSTFTCSIPAEPDNSPRFAATIDAVCGGKEFKLEFKATDPDGDKLTYSFEGAYDGGMAQSAENINPEPPPYNFLSYRGVYSWSQPLGPKAAIDPETGIISGIAPPEGRYVVTVGVTSWRNGKKIGTHRKDFIINVSGCDFATAQLFPRGTYCDDYVGTFENDDYSPYNKTFNWEFYNADSSFSFLSAEEKPEVSFPKEGRYHYKLVVNRGGQCSDSAMTSIDVYPGFFPRFNFDGKCINSEVFFTDQSTAQFGSINKWKWNFGDGRLSSDTSVERHPKFTYTQEGVYDVALTVESSVGCVGTVRQKVKMIQKPEFSVSNDTLICSIDTLQLQAFGKSGSRVTWTPNYEIDHIESFTPNVRPRKTTVYYANYEESRGCNNLDSVLVNVVDQVSLKMPADTTICLTDSIILRPKSDGLHYQWTPAQNVIDNTQKNAVVYPGRNTTYSVLATIGNCNTRGSMRVTTIPYPAARAVPDTTLCLGSRVQLQAVGGSVYEWQPSIFLNDHKISNPVSSPNRSIQYIVKVNDFLGCPKPGFDTLMLKVIEPHVDGGPRDTAIVVGEPLQLSARGNGENFLWTPPTGLSDPYVPNPIALPDRDQQYIVRVLTEGNCIAFDTIDVKVYNLKPGFYVPNAFTPNNDGLNDIIRPIAFGLKTLRFFRIYNRAGELIFSTNHFREGWDGTYKGVALDPAVFAWTAEAVDYTGKRVQAKGSITLIR